MNSPSRTQTIERIAASCAQKYGIAGDLTRLHGENFNFLICTEDQRRYVLKLTGDDLPEELLTLEHRVIEHLQAANLNLKFPSLIINREGAFVTRIQRKDGTTLYARLLEFVAGTPWGESSVPNTDRLHDLGRVLAEIDLALSSFDHPAAHRTHRWDLAQAATHHRDQIPLVRDVKGRRILEYMFHLYAGGAVPFLPSLRHSLIHGDANDENLLVEGERVVGLLDFADCCYNPTVCELAIALAYTMMGASDPLGLGAQLVGSYHEIHPLLQSELAVLYPLLCGRLCTTVTVAAERREIDPDHPTWFVTEGRAWALLERLCSLDPVEAGTRLASETGLDPFEEYRGSNQFLLAQRKRHLSSSLSLAHDQPLKIVRGVGQYLYDDRGRPYLDLVNNVCHVGHCHPHVVGAGQRQMARLNTNTRYLYDALTEYAERLTMKLPEPLDTCFFVNSGSEANELALRLAATHTNREDFVVLEGAYHGNTARLIELSPYKFLGNGGSGRPAPWVHVAPMPDGYRGVHKGSDRKAGIAYGDEVGRVIAESKNPIAGFLVEPLLSCGGMIVPPEGYLERAFQHVREVKGVCIADEVQIGFGRVGKHFWGFELQDVVPDIVVMGKPIGNGHPLAAVVTTREIASSFETGMEFFSTFGGNPVSCAIGLAVLEVIESQSLQAHAMEIGTRLREGLQALMLEHALIGEVRGEGLFIGVELVQDRDTMAPADLEAKKLVERMKARGMLLATEGMLHNVLKIKPPLVLTAQDVDMVVRAFDDELSLLRAERDHSRHQEPR